MEQDPGCNLGELRTLATVDAEGVKSRCREIQFLLLRDMYLLSVSSLYMHPSPGGSCNPDLLK